MEDDDTDLGDGGNASTWRRVPVANRSTDAEVGACHYRMASPPLPVSGGGDA